MSNIKYHKFVVFLFFLIALLYPKNIFAADNTEPGSLNLSSTFNSIGIEILFSGDDNGNSSASLQFKKESEGSYKDGLPLWRTEGSEKEPQKAFYGSILQLDHNSTYKIKITLSDPDGVSGDSVINASIKTREDNIPSVSTLVPAYFVSSGGDDGNSGTTEDKAWRSLEKAVTSVPSGVVVQVGSGYFQAPKSIRTTPLIIKAKFPAVDEGGNVINSGKHTVLEGAILSLPAGATDGPNPGVWQQVTLNGYTVWKWAGGGNPSQLGYATSRSDLPKRVVRWKSDNKDLSTPEGWAEKVYTNKSYNFGYYIKGTDIYMKMPFKLNPNELYITGGSGEGLIIDGSNIRVTGLEIRQFGSGILFKSNSSFGVLDHNLLSGNGNGVEFSGNKSTTPNKYGSDHTIEKNRIVDSSLWGSNLSDDIIPWGFIKGKIINADGSAYTDNRIGEGSETDAIGTSGGASKVVIRKNVIDGPFNGIGSFNKGYDRYSANNWDIYENTFMHLIDDTFEPEGNIINWRMWGNNLENVHVVLSTGPVNYGPLYLFRNSAWRVGVVNGPGGVARGNFFKYSGSSSPTARVYVVNNTFWSDFGTEVDGSGQYAGGGPNQESFYLRNNIMRSTRYAFQSPPAAKFDEYANHFATSDITRGFEFGGKKYKENVLDYRSAYKTAKGLDTNTNIGWTPTGAGSFLDVIFLDSNFINPLGGNLGLKPCSSFIDKGVKVPNISDIGFIGIAPDLGVAEVSIFEVCALNFEPLGSSVQNSEANADREENTDATAAKEKPQRGSDEASFLTEKQAYKEEQARIRQELKAARRAEESQKN